MDRGKQFHSLKAISNADLGIYEDAFEFATKNADVRNIAVTGPYGAGKSTLVETYFSVHKDLKPVSISLAHFNFPENKPSEDENDIRAVGDTDTPYQAEQIIFNRQSSKQSADSLNDEGLEIRLEAEIINQLIHKTSPNAIRDSRFKRKTVPDLRKIGIEAALFTAWAFAVIALFNWSRICDWMLTSFGANANWTDSPMALCLVFLAALIGAAGWLAFLMVQLQRNRVVKSIALKDCSIELFQAADEPCFSKYLDEVLYLFQKSGYRMFIFEDLDRFNNMEIFEQLRKINNLLNGETGDIRFFYLVRDGLFTERDRAKFFDFIIPVVPYIEGSNTFDVISRVTHWPKNREPDQMLLNRVSLYVDDMRVLKNISNEYSMYYEKIGRPLEASIDEEMGGGFGSNRLIPNKLYSMVLYKNLYPFDYDCLCQHKGALYYVLSEYKKNLISEIIKELKEKIREKESQLEMADKEHLEAAAEVDALYASTEINSIAGGKRRAEYSSNKEYFEAIRSEEQYPNTNAGRAILSGIRRSTHKAEYEQRLENVALRDKRKRAIIEEELKELNEQIDEVKQQPLAELITMKEGQVECLRKTLVKYGIFDKVDLLTLLLRMGWIAEDYASYLTYFFEGKLSKADKRFLLHVSNGKPLDYKYKIDDPDEILGSLNDVDFKGPATLNYNLVHAVIEQGPSKRLEALANQITKKHAYDFLAGYLNEYDDAYKFVSYINSADARTYAYLAISSEISLKDVEEYACLCIEHENSSVLSAINFAETLGHNLSSSESALFRLSRNPQLYEDILYHLEIVGARFEHLSTTGINYMILDGVYERRLFALNCENIAFILSRYYQESVLDWARALTLIRSDSSQALCAEVEAKPSVFLASALTKTNEFRDSQDSALFLLSNTDLSPDEKAAYISKLRTKLDDISEIEDVAILEKLLSQNLISFTSVNMLSLFRANQYKLEKNTLAFFNASDGFCLDFRDNEEEAKNFMEALIVTDGVDVASFEETLECSYCSDESFAIKNVPDVKMRLLIAANYIVVNEDNLLFIKENYEPMLSELIGRDPAAFVDLLKEGLNITEDDMLAILGSDEIRASERIEIAKAYGLPISIKDLDYSDDAIIAGVLRHNYFKNDLSCVIGMYDQASDELKTLIKMRVAEAIEDVIKTKEEISTGLLSALIKDENISLDTRKNLLSRRIENFDEAEIPGLLNGLGLGTLNEVFEGKNPKIEYTPANEDLLIALESLDWAFSSHSKTNDGMLRVYSRSVFLSGQTE